jgi:hypothetical protein
MAITNVKRGLTLNIVATNAANEKNIREFQSWAVTNATMLKTAIARTT